MIEQMIAALFVETDGCYFNLPDVDPWDVARDARQYPGPWPIIAHPPCARWGRYWFGGPTAKVRRKLGDDDGCFGSALLSLLSWGGVLEHPAYSHAWAAFNLPRPNHKGGWLEIEPDFWTCHVEQGWYGHKARKATWLLVKGPQPLELQWGKAPGDFVRIDAGFHSIEERRRAVKTGACQLLSKRQRQATPIPFRDLLITIATCRYRVRTPGPISLDFCGPGGSKTRGESQFSVDNPRWE